MSDYLDWEIVTLCAEYVCWFLLIPANHNYRKVSIERSGKSEGMIPHSEHLYPHNKCNLFLKNERRRVFMVCEY